jgi:hypothetical protein
MQVATTSADAYAAIAPRKRKMQVDKVFDIVVSLQQRGAADLSLREIAQEYHRKYGKPIDVGTVSARVTNLVIAKRLVRVQGSERPCSITGKTVHPVCAPARQVGMF